MPETERQYFEEGGPAKVRAAPRPDLVLDATIVSFGKMPHDLSEKEEAR